MSQISLNTFIQTAQAAEGTDRTVKVSGGAIQTQGKVGAFFTRSSTHRGTIDSFVQALRAEYGDQAGRMAGTMLQGLKESGKPLQARMVQQLAGQARTEALNAFLHDAPGLEPGGLDQAVDQLLAKQGLPEDQRGLVRQLALETLQSGRGEFNSLTGLFNQVAQGRLPGLEELAGLLKNGPSHPFNQMPGTLADKIRLISLSSVAPSEPTTMMFLVPKLAEMRALQPNGPLTPETVWRAAFGEALPPGLVAAKPAGLARAMTEKADQALDGLVAEAEALAQTRGTPVPSISGSVRDSLMVVPPETLAQGIREGLDIRVPNPALPGDTLNANINSRMSANPPELIFARMLGELNGMAGRRYEGGIEFVVTGTDGETATVQLPKDTGWAGSVVNDWLNVLKGQPVSPQHQPKVEGMRQVGRQLEMALGTLDGDQPLTEAQAKSLINCMSQNGNFILRKLEHALALDRKGETLTYTLNLSRGENGDVQLQLLTRAPQDGLDPERAKITFTIRPDGTVSGSDLFVKAGLEPADYSRKAVDVLLSRDGSPHSFLNLVNARVQALSPGLAVGSKALPGLEARLRTEMISLFEGAERPTPEQLQAVRDAILNEFLDQLAASAGRIENPERRTAFIQASLSTSVSLPGLPPALGPVTARLGGEASQALNQVLRSGDAGAIRETLANLGQALAGPLDDEQLRGAVIRQGLLEAIGPGSPDSLVRGLAREGGPFRDFLYDLAQAPPGGPEAERLTGLVGLIRRELAALGVPAETLARLDGAAIEEKNLSPDRQRALLGPGVFQTRGANLGQADLNARLARDWPALTEDIRQQALQDLFRDGLRNKTEPPNDPSWQLHRVCLGDYKRDGLLIDGRYHHPTRTGTSPEALVALFPDRRSAAFLSNLLGQNFQGFITDALVRSRGRGDDPQSVIDGPGLLVNTIGHHQVASGTAIQDMRLETLDAGPPGRYRLTALVAKVAAEAPEHGMEESSVERIMYEVSLEVTLGDPPTVDSVRAELLIRGREGA